MGSQPLSQPSRPLWFSLWPFPGKDHAAHGVLSFRSQMWTRALVLGLGQDETLGVTEGSKMASQDYCLISGRKNIQYVTQRKCYTNGSSLYYQGRNPQPYTKEVWIGPVGAGRALPWQQNAPAVLCAPLYELTFPQQPVRREECQLCLTDGKLRHGAMKCPSRSVSNRK